MLASAFSPRRVESELRRLQAGTEVPDQIVDAAIGLRIRAIEDRLDLSSLLQRYGPRFFEEGDLHWRYMAELWREIERLPISRVLDLGSGYGRLVFFGAICVRLEVMGIELVEERVREATRVRDNLGLHNATFSQGDVVDAAWPDADCICLMNSLTHRERDAVLNRIEALSRSTPLFVASCSNTNIALARKEWFEVLYSTSGTLLGIQIGRTLSFRGQRV